MAYDHSLGRLKEASDGARWFRPGCDAFVGDRDSFNDEKLLPKIDAF
jgi:hypothetical protein